MSDEIVKSNTLLTRKQKAEARSREDYKMVNASRAHGEVLNSSSINLMEKDKIVDNTCPSIKADSRQPCMLACLRFSLRLQLSKAIVKKDIMTINKNGSMAAKCNT